MSADDLLARLARVLDRVDPAPTVHTATLLALHSRSGTEPAPAVHNPPTTHSQFSPGGSR
ncbi:hypothetical protein JNUCC0626_35615 [Lentzea sp. JNUCC 0626]|uniref:hypothetical protein n=1 Tax=Lentzea sp. JNUCC 0626 TaxID=3367513 RepID=UPI0037480558